MFQSVLLVLLVAGPSETHARHLLPKGPKIGDLLGNITRTAYLTPYSGCNGESCACGVPPELLQDEHGAPLAYAALNIQVRDMVRVTPFDPGDTAGGEKHEFDVSGNNILLPMQNTGMGSRQLSRPIRSPSKEMGMFNNGHNCGRWVEITYQDICVGDDSGAASQPPVICGVNAVIGDPRINYSPDSKTGIKAYALVADACADNTYWCDLHATMQQILFAQLNVPDTRHYEWIQCDARTCNCCLLDSDVLCRRTSHCR